MDKNINLFKSENRLRDDYIRNRVIAISEVLIIAKDKLGADTEEKVKVAQYALMQLYDLLISVNHK